MGRTYLMLENCLFLPLLLLLQMAPIFLDCPNTRYLLCMNAMVITSRLVCRLPMLKCELEAWCVAVPLLYPSPSKVQDATLPPSRAMGQGGTAAEYHLHPGLTCAYRLINPSVHHDRWLYACRKYPGPLEEGRQWETRFKSRFSHCLP